MALGKSPKGSHAAAAKEIGNPALEANLKSQAWGWAWIEGLLHDIRYALRRLRRDRGFTITVLLTLALGIGANLAVFQILYSVLLAGLPVSHPEDLVRSPRRSHAFRSGLDSFLSAYQRLRTAIPEVSMLARASGGPVSLELPNHLLTSPDANSFLTITSPCSACPQLPGDCSVRPMPRKTRASGQPCSATGLPATLLAQRSRPSGSNTSQWHPIRRRWRGPRAFPGPYYGLRSRYWLPLALQSTGKFTYSWVSPLARAMTSSSISPGITSPPSFWPTGDRASSLRTPHCDSRKAGSGLRPYPK